MKVVERKCAVAHVGLVNCIEIGEEDWWVFQFHIFKVIDHLNCSDQSPNHEQEIPERYWDHRDPAYQLRDLDESLCGHRRSGVVLGVDQRGLLFREEHYTVTQCGLQRRFTRVGVAGKLTRPGHVEALLMSLTCRIKCNLHLSAVTGDWVTVPY